MKTKQVKRINITLPETTLQKLDQVAQAGNRSQFIDKAVHFYISKVGRERLRAALKEGAIEQAQQDLDIATQWFKLEEEIWE